MPDAMPIRPLTRQECGEASMLARLSRENWDEMTRAARTSPNHPGNLDRWIRAAEEANPDLDPGQVQRLAEKLRTAHFRKLARARWAQPRTYSSGAPDEQAS